MKKTLTFSVLLVLAFVPSVLADIGNVVAVNGQVRILPGNDQSRAVAAQGQDR